MDTSLKIQTHLLPLPLGPLDSQDASELDLGGTTFEVQLAFKHPENTARPSSSAHLSTSDLKNVAV